MECGLLCTFTRLHEQNKQPRLMKSYISASPYALAYDTPYTERGCFRRDRRHRPYSLLCGSTTRQTYPIKDVRHLYPFNHCPSRPTDICRPYERNKQPRLMKTHIRAPPCTLTLDTPYTDRGYCRRDTRHRPFSLLYCCTIRQSYLIKQVCSPYPYNQYPSRPTHIRRPCL